MLGNSALGLMGELYLSFLWSPVGTGLTEIRVEMEFWDWLEANEDVSRLSGDMGGVMRLGLLHSECDKDPNTHTHRQIACQHLKNF